VGALGGLHGRKGIVGSGDVIGAGRASGRTTGAVLLGAKELEAKLGNLEKRVSKKAISAGIRAGMTPVVKAMRAAINSNVYANASMKAGARRAVGKRFNKKRHKQIREAIVGFAVGRRGSRRYQLLSKHKRPRGVGIAAANIHWFVLGTDIRLLATSAQYTGRMGAFFRGVTEYARTASSPFMFAEAAKKIKQVINREAQKRG